MIRFLKVETLPFEIKGQIQIWSRSKICDWTPCINMNVASTYTSWELHDYRTRGWYANYYAKGHDMPSSSSLERTRRLASRALSFAHYLTIIIAATLRGVPGFRVLMTWITRVRTNFREQGMRGRHTRCPGSTYVDKQNEKCSRLLAFNENLCESDVALAIRSHGYRFFIRPFQLIYTVEISGKKIETIYGKLFNFPRESPQLFNSHSPHALSHNFPSFVLVSHRKKWR